MKRLLIWLTLLAPGISTAQQDPLPAAIEKLLFSDTISWRYPQTLTRIYRLRNFQPIWTNSNAVNLLLAQLDSVETYGLCRQDFKLPAKNQSARFDLALTESVVHLMHYLHYGKLNPDFGVARIDAGMDIPLLPETVLTAFLNDQQGFKWGSLAPQTPDYQLLSRALQGMAPTTAGYQHLAVNLERLRWLNDVGPVYLQINIPAYQLTYHQPGTTMTFKIIVGKPETPTPTLQSAVNYFTAAPEWHIPQKIFENELLPNAINDLQYLTANHYEIYDDEGQVTDLDRSLLLAIKRAPGGYYARQTTGCDNTLGRLVFRFPNGYDISLHDLPEKTLFDQAERALSSGCISLEQPEELARLLLIADGQAKQVKQLQKRLENEEQKHFVLRRAVPIRIVYLTCVPHAGQLISYSDIYGLDARLWAALFNMY